MRSLLFVPGDSARKFARASEGVADALILDLEDSVSPDNKPAARRETRAMLEAPRGAQQRLVRVNALDTPWTLEDLNAVMPAQPDGIVLPKCADAGQVRHVGLWLDAFETAYGIPPGQTRILAIATETPAAIFGLGGYAAAGPRLMGLTWGAEDLAAALGATANRIGGEWLGPYRLARELCLAGAAAAGVPAYDTVYVDIADLAGLSLETLAAKRDGFAGKMVIHPSHALPVNEAFMPTAEELHWAGRVVATFADGSMGATRMDGKMLDRPHLKLAERLLAQAGRA